MMRFSPVLKLWNRLSRRSQSIVEDGRRTLPTELWNHIFLQLDDDTLFVVAAVCRPFNELSVRIVLLTNGIVYSDLIAGDFTVPSRLLPILLRAPFMPSIKNLSCIFEESNLSLHLRLIRALVAQSSDLSSVELWFPPTASEPFARHRVLRSVLSPMVSHTPRDIILVSHRHCLRCSARDLFKKLRGPPIAFITSLKLHFQRKRLDGLRPFTIVVVNEFIKEIPFTSLTLGHTHDGSDDSRMSVAHLSAMLHKLALPHLKNLIITAPHIDPSALRDFLISHPQVQSIIDSRPTPLHRAALLCPPLALPNLCEIGATTIKELLSMLVATAPSLPRTISFPFTNEETDPHPSLFHYLAQRNIPTQLKIAVFFTPGRFTETDFALVRTLHCVDAVHIICVRIEDGAALLPWLNALPALSTVEFEFVGFNRWEYDDLPFFTLARASLARPEVTIRILWTNRAFEY
ncbi:hypothetical protein B0H12DRAFT_105966 [Mycena haematopus]|nr:hypothetical protein B0H12DRAFT_105966 [Mycena haematopus]